MEICTTNEIKDSDNEMTEWLRLDKGLLDRIECDRCGFVGLSIWKDGRIYCKSCRKIQD
jgi:uncharacterized Zn finger protein (UPF0148 family)